MELKQNIIRNAIGLSLFALLTAGLIAATQQSTKTQIADNQAEFAARQLVDLLPEAFKQQDILNQQVALSNNELSLIGKATTDNGWQVLDSEGNIAGIILPVSAPNAYTETIELLVGIAADGELWGVRVAHHKETPGLGDQIEIKKSDWILQFDGKSLTMPMPELWAVKKDGGEFDQLTGATITPRAIVNAVRNSLQYFQANQQGLLIRGGQS
ncbi:electron transport complex subunit RsxG [Salinibius halmophilus]|uniref:electron transport complex subunit RsxG n=1 Tax=Salinibius halmophilus TaxID=1853216 RepID=UPI000E66B0A4|nr:electron transport complex subunit RsxG [Salinibius halmophilus]